MRSSVWYVNIPFRLCFIELTVSFPAIAALTEVINETRQIHAGQFNNTNQSVQTLMNEMLQKQHTHHGQVVQAVSSAGGGIAKSMAETSSADMKKILGKEVLRMFEEVGRIRDSKRTLEAEMGELFQLRAKYGKGGKPAPPAAMSPPKHPASPAKQTPPSPSKSAHLSSKTPPPVAPASPPNAPSPSQAELPPKTASPIPVPSPVPPPSARPAARRPCLPMPPSFGQLPWTSRLPPPGSHPPPPGGITR